MELYVYYSLFDLEQLDVEGEGGVGRNDAGVATATVGIVRRANQLGALADAQLGNSLIPATDDLALADGELEWLVAVARRIELGAIVQGAGVVDRDLLAILGIGAAITRSNWNYLYAHFD